ncbi:MAG: M20/M25/M40 family metallo-hydrolase [Pseudomonadota bacterium]|nr:M20/M25/M40 family metallo-hydrolase [Pseudomonadota bacterium]
MLVRGFIISALLSTAAAAQPANDARRAAERDLFEKVVETPTVYGRIDEFRKLTRLLTAEFRKAGITNVVVKDHDGTQTLIARWPAARPSGKKPILLLAHMDVVEANPADWKNPPFELREQDGYYLGRGASDNKAALTGLVLALQELKRSGFQPTRDIIVLFTGDEETHMNSVRRAATEWRDLIDAEYVLNGDAGGGTVYKDGRIDAFYMQIAEKTYADYKLVATNKGGHSSSPRPDNAIYALTGALERLEDYRFEPMINDATRAYFGRIAADDKGRYGELVRKWLSNPQDRETADLLEANAPGYTRTRCVATQLSGGHAPNALPQKADANVNCRIFPGVAIEAVKADLEARAGPDVTVNDRKFAPVGSQSAPRRRGRGRGLDALPRCAGGAGDVGGRDRRRFFANHRNAGLRLWRPVGNRRRTVGRARPRRASADRGFSRSGSDLGRHAAPAGRVVKKAARLPTRPLSRSSF